MTAIAYPVWNVIKGFSNATKFFLLAILLGLLSFEMATVDTPYTELTPVSATVIAKTQMPSSSRSQSTPLFILATRQDDGTLRDVYTSFSAYSTTEVGGNWTVFTSPQIRDESIPAYEVVRRVIAVLALVGVAVSLAGGISNWIQDE